MNEKILVVDDELPHCKMLEAVLTGEGYRVTTAFDGISAVDEVKKSFFDLVLMDIRMNKMGGIEALKHIRELSPAMAVVIMTAYASVDTAVDALKSGAYDYLTKPLDTNDLIRLIRKALKQAKPEQDHHIVNAYTGHEFDFSGIVGNSGALNKLFETMSFVASSDATVLIRGESGTGKELVADAIHRNSPRKHDPFIKVNCAALPETLLESELFGHEKGAFTGANEKKKGRFQLAHKGSVFLDEIGDMPLITQVKLLRVIQEREFEPLGSMRTEKVDIRIITATNRNLEERISQGLFREDLYYRLNVVALTTPPLRDRGNDIMELAGFFLKKYSEKNNRLIKGFTPHATDILMRYAWPGNVRELENIIERAVILSRTETVTPEDFPDTVRHHSAETKINEEVPEGKSLKDIERQMIIRTLDETGGNRTKTADILGISRRTLQMKLKEYGINP